MSDNSYTQAAAQMESIKEMIAALNVDYDRLEELKEARLPWVAGRNMPGYMPDSEPAAFETFEEAKGYIIEELKWFEEEAETEEEAEDYCHGAEDVNLQSGEFSSQIGTWVYWVARADNGGLSPEDAEELAELEEAAGDCESEDEARQRIEEDALDVSVRSDWYSPGGGLLDARPSEFRILLCTGGPAVQIRGELDNYLQPSHAWIEHQDWFEPWQEYHGENVDKAVLLAYCQQFYFGE